jgi:asparagine synthase (glutamine-hydrolysing)
VLLQGYEKCGLDALLKRLRGMFAFAIYDRRERLPRLLLARDRFGIKPLYYSFRNQTLVFASETKALAKSGLVDCDTSREALAGFLLYGSVPAPATWYSHIRCLPAGHYLMNDGAGYREIAYELSDLPPPETPLSSILREAVAQHLISDVPLGVFLSGGVDSTALVALASRDNSASLRTLTVRFEEPEYDESPVARQTAQHFGTQHMEVTVTAQDFVSELPNILRSMDQPAHDGINTYFIARAARQAGLTVVLSGLGGDEVFWGYPHYKWLAAPSGPLSQFSHAPAFIRRALIRGAAALAADVTAAGLYRLVRGFFAPRQVARLLDASESEIIRIAEAALETASGSLPEQFNDLEMRNYLHNQLLRDTDAFSMAHSIEVRVPLLDHCVVNAAAAFAADQKIAGDRNKPLLVDAVNDPVIDRLARSKKRGFTFPFAKWMREQSGTLEPLALQSHSLNRKTVKRLYHNFRNGRLHWSRAWALAVAGGR